MAISISASIPRWQDTGVDVSIGDTLDITASGTVSWQKYISNGWVDPDGIGPMLNQDPGGDLVPDTGIYNALVGKIDGTSADYGAHTFSAYRYNLPRSAALNAPPNCKCQPKRYLRTCCASSIWPVDSCRQPGNAGVFSPLLQQSVTHELHSSTVETRGFHSGWSGQFGRSHTCPGLRKQSDGE